MALDRTGYEGLAVAGGVACNSALRAAMSKALSKRRKKLWIPSPILCTDNGAMVAAAAYQKARLGLYASGRLDVFPGLNIETQLGKLEE